ncbi:MAG TPA: FMN-binding negative transcriptional regulator [Oleiagrimonas sp.]|nr:FMN-binding negative transcriptional regulator [Oleiagrimonas sp.]
MHIPRHFQEARPEVLHDLMHAHPFATVVVHTEDGLVANHLPFERVGDTLQTHVARGNELAGMDGKEALVIFRGSQAYISPNWYPTKRETGREVPTWDYAVVHVHGHMKVIDDAAWLRDLLERLTTHHEAGEPEPWRISDAPADHIEQSLRAIVGIEIPIERLVGKFKLNQNHPERNRRGIVEGLRRRNTGDDQGLADLMVRHAGSES